jgi:hypothetical protein
MKKSEYIEKYPFGTRCSFTKEYIEEKVSELRKKLSRTGSLLSKNYRTQKVWVSWDDVTTAQQYPIKIINLIK